MTFSLVLSFVHRCGPDLAETFATIFTLVGFVLHVGEAVDPKVVLPLEGLVAGVAVVGSLVRVGPDVNLKVVALIEFSVAYGANKNLAPFD